MEVDCHINLSKVIEGTESAKCLIALEHLYSLGKKVRTRLLGALAHYLISVWPVLHL